MAEIKSEYTIIDGQRYVIVKPGGATASDGSDAGLVLAEIIGIRGTKSSRVLDLPRVDLAGVAPADDQRYDDPIGVKAFRVMPLKSASTTMKAVAFAYSTTQGLTAVNVSLVAFAASAQSPTTAGGVDYEDTGILIAQYQGSINSTNGTGKLWEGDTGWIKWDGANRIKTIAVGGVGGTHAHGAILQFIR